MLLAELFHSVLYEEGELFAEANGEPVLRFPPWPAQNEEGWCVVIPAIYFIHVKQSINTVASQLNRIVLSVQECTEMITVSH